MTHTVFRRAGPAQPALTGRGLLSPAAWKSTVNRRDYPAVLRFRVSRIPGATPGCLAFSPKLEKNPPPSPRIPLPSGFQKELQSIEMHLLQGVRGSHHFSQPLMTSSVRPPRGSGAQIHRSALEMAKQDQEVKPAHSQESLLLARQYRNDAGPAGLLPGAPAASSSLLTACLACCV